MDKTLQFYAPIEKTNSETHMVYGYASTEALDSQGEVVKRDAMKAALDDYMKFANIREMHQPSAVGKTKKANIDSKGMYIAAKVIDPLAWEKVKEGVYSGFSIGGRVEKMIDNEITSLKLSEISLVDRPANPEAVFDVWKADGIEKEDRAVAEPPKEPDGNAIAIDNTPAVEETPVVAEVTEPAKEEAVSESVVTDEKEESGTQPLDEGSKDITEEPQAAEEKPAAEPVEEKTEEPKDEVTDETKEEPATEEVKETAEKTELEKIEDNLKAGKMPTDEELDFILKSQDIEVNQKNRDVMKYHLAGVLIKFIEENMVDQQNKDAAKKDAEKAQKETPIVVAEKKHQFDEVLVLIKKLESQLKKSTSSQVSVPPPAKASPKSPAETSNPVLELLRQAVELLTSQNQGNQLSPKERNTEGNGASEGSERHAGGHFDPNDVIANPSKGSKADMPELKKLEDEVTVLKEEIKKLADTPMPIKAHAAYSVIEKFETTDDVKVELEKAEKRADELHELMKQYPANEGYVTEAQALSSSIMRLRRETR
jgi:phage head maturation protease